EQWQLEGWRTGPCAAPELPSAEALAAYDRDAAVGGRLDPDNAYFPFMRAAGLLAGRRDEEALAAVRRAGGKRGWEDYASAETAGGWRLCEAMGARGNVPRTINAAHVLLPQYATMARVTWVATYLASRAEAAGRVEEGLAVRASLARYGS